MNKKKTNTTKKRIVNPFSFSEFLIFLDSRISVLCEARELEEIEKVVLINRASFQSPKDTK
jgi:hypothetical protein